MARKQAGPSARALIAAFAGVAVCFVVSTIVAEYGEVKIRRAATHITENAAPSIVHLEAFRSEARRLVVLADDYVDQSVEQRRQDTGAARRGTRDARGEAHPIASFSPSQSLLSTRALAERALAASLARLEAEWRIYRSLPTFRGEGELAVMASSVKEGFVTDLRRALDAARAGDAATALEVLDHRVKPSADAVDDATVKLVELDAHEATRLGSRIEALGKRSIRVAAALDGLSVLLTILATFLVYRFMRRYTRLVEERAEELELFAGRVAHDVLSPLGAANLALSYLNDKAAIDDPRARRLLALGLRSIARTRLIADDLLEFASAGAHPDPTARADVRTVVVAVIDEARPLAEERRITLTVDGVDVGSVRCGQGILSSLVSNLVRNAVKYVGEGPGKLVVVRARRLGAFTRVEVEDNGPGLPVAMEAAVFQPYVRVPGNNQPGIGLGLATVKRVAEAHGGRVDVRSRLNAGCRFAFELPSAPDDGPAPARARTQKGDRFAHENALPPPEKPPRVGHEDDARKDTNPSGHAV